MNLKQFTKPQKKEVSVPTKHSHSSKNRLKNDYGVNSTHPISSKNQFYLTIYGGI